MYIIAFREEHINQNYYSDMFVIIRFICTRLFGKDKVAKERAVDVLQLLREYAEPKLWHEVSHHIVSDGELESTVTAASFPDLEFLLISGEAREVTSLK